MVAIQMSVFTVFHFVCHFFAYPFDSMFTDGHIKASATHIPFEDAKETWFMAHNSSVCNVAKAYLKDIEHKFVEKP